MDRFFSVRTAILGLVTDDADLDARLHQLKTASEPSRFRLLRHAAVDGPFMATQAWKIAGGNNERGTTARSSHAEALVRSGLLAQSDRPVQYSATQAGVATYEALRAFAEGPAEHAQPDTELLVLAVAEPTFNRLREALGRPGDLAATLERHLGEHTEVSALHVRIDERDVSS
jgi:hypothetical protein